MTIWEIIRMICYVISAPTLLYLALVTGRRRMYAQTALCASWSILYIWYMVEITIAATGVNTREYRVIGTPMVVAATISAVWMAVNSVWPRLSLRSRER